MEGSVADSKRTGFWRQGPSNERVYDNISECLRNQIIEVFERRGFWFLVECVAYELLNKWGRPVPPRDKRVFSLLGEVRETDSPSRVLEFVEWVLTCPRNEAQFEAVGETQSRWDEVDWCQKSDGSYSYFLRNEYAWDGRGDFEESRARVVEEINDLFQKCRVGYIFEGNRVLVGLWEVPRWGKMRWILKYSVWRPVRWRVEMFAGWVYRERVFWTAWTGALAAWFAAGLAWFGS